MSIMDDFYNDCTNRIAKLALQDGKLTLDVLLAVHVQAYRALPWLKRVWVYWHFPAVVRFAVKRNRSE